MSLGLDSHCLIAHKYGEQIWSKVVVRKHKVCVITGKVLKGKEAYMPVTNLGNRMERISPEGIENTQKKGIAYG